MKIIDFDLQLKLLEECLTVRYGIMPNTGVHHKKKDWLRWWYSKNTQKEIRIIKEEEEACLQH